MSDTMLNRLFSGNSEKRWETSERTSLRVTRRRLVEECEAVSVHVLQRAFGKKSLITAIRQVQPLRLPVSGGCFEIWLIDEAHWLPGRSERRSSLEEGTARLWLICTGCKQKVAKLFYYVLAGSSTLSDLLCRQCHHLTYLSVNSGGNRWYCEIARPMKRLLLEKSKLLGKRQRPSIAARLTRIEVRLAGFRQLAGRLTKRRKASIRRPYRDLSLLT